MDKRREEQIVRQVACMQRQNRMAMRNGVLIDDDLPRPHPVRKIVRLEQLQKLVASLSLGCGSVRERDLDLGRGRSHNDCKYRHSQPNTHVTPHFTGPIDSDSSYCML